MGHTRQQRVTYYQDHKEQIAAYRKVHKEQIAAYTKRYRETHKEYFKNYMKIYHQNHRMQGNGTQYQAEYQRTHLESWRRWNRKHYWKGKEELRTWYVKHCIHSMTGLRSAEIPDEYVKAYRQIFLLKREVKSRRRSTS